MAAEKEVRKGVSFGMRKTTWKARIKKACQEAGTYQPFFDNVIDTLAGILENRDKAQKQFEKTGGNPVVMHTNKNGAKNAVKNPALVMVMDCNQQALAYWRDLGLTPKGLKALDDKALQNNKRSSLDDVLADLGV